MSRAFCIPAAILLFCALVLNLLASISLPFLPGLDIVRTQLSGEIVLGSQPLTQIRFGIWAPCYYDSQGDRTCLPSSNGYNITIPNTNGNDIAFVNSSWTRGLILQPIATIVTFFAFFFALFSTNCAMPIIASLVSFLAALLTLISFFIDIAFFVLVRNELDRLSSDISTNTAPGFWLTFVALILLLIGGCTVCFAHRRERRLSNANTNPNTRRGGRATTTPKTKTPMWSRNKRNQV